MNRKIRMGMVGGGIGSFIGEVHRMASRLDGQIELVCGSFSSDPDRSRQSGRELFLQDDRIYANFQEMIDREKELPEGERMDFISIVTPNHMHFQPAKMALENGFHVVVDKPLAFNREEAMQLQDLVQETGLQFCVTYTYTGYPMVKEARELVSSGVLGKIRKINVEYPQGWLSTRLEESEQKQADWRTDPKRSGKSGCMGDIGTHAENMAEYISGLEISEMCSELKIFVEGRRLDDDGAVLLRFENGATGTLMASQICAGEENNLKIRVYGEKGGLEWSHVNPNTLLVKWLDKPAEIRRTGVDNGYLSERALNHTRIPSGHPEGYLEAFANIYRNFAITVRSVINNKSPDPAYTDFPGVKEGIRGMAFIDHVVKSSQENKWVKFEY